MQITVKGDILKYVQLVRIRLNLTSTLGVELFDTEISGINRDHANELTRQYINRYKQTRSKSFDVKATLLITNSDGNYHSYETDVNNDDEVTVLAYLTNSYTNQLVD